MPIGAEPAEAALMSLKIDIRGNLAIARMNFPMVNRPEIPME